MRVALKGEIIMARVEEIPEKSKTPGLDRIVEVLTWKKGVGALLMVAYAASCIAAMIFLP